MAPGLPHPTFPSFLLNAIPFRRKSSSASTTTAATASPPTTDPPSYLTGHRATISCARCHADLALTTQIISKGFTGRYGRAYLVSPRATASTYTTLSAIDAHVPGDDLPNTKTHKAIPRHLVTGMHVVCDISCALCGLILGWKYLAADDEAQRYKVGKFILESKRTLVASAWDGSELASQPRNLDDVDPDEFNDQLGIEQDASSVLFDSQDEDECEDLFSGIWSPELAKRRRRRKELRD